MKPRRTWLVFTPAVTLGKVTSGSRMEALTEAIVKFAEHREELDVRQGSEVIEEAPATRRISLCHRVE